MDRYYELGVKIILYGTGLTKYLHDIRDRANAECESGQDQMECPCSEHVEFRRALVGYAECLHMVAWGLIWAPPLVLIGFAILIIEIFDVF